ncbi:hypothetical protein FHS18_006930, partial [Paenibacillus phyllosphaerae]
LGVLHQQDNFKPIGLTIQESPTSLGGGSVQAGLIVMSDHMYNIKIESTKVLAQYLDVDFTDGSDDLKAMSSILRQEIDSLKGLRNLIIEGNDVLKPEAQNHIK